MKGVSATTEMVSQGVDLSVWHAISSASPVVQATLIVLVLMSVFCWGVFLHKRSELKKAHKNNDKFEDVFYHSKSLDDVYSILDDFKGSTFVEVFESGYKELHALVSESNQGKEKEDIRLLSGVDNLERALNKSVQTQISRLESKISLLATTGSTGPFIGLFGTVWGIMGAFQKIGQTGSANLAVVAPGISEALVATAIGLLAAIPATVMYNHFVGEIKKQEIDLTNFSSDFLNIVKRNFF